MTQNQTIQIPQELLDNQAGESKGCTTQPSQTQNNKPKDLNRFYVYLHRRNDNNEVFYVGKGCGNRAKRSDGRNVWWKRVVDKAKGFTIEFVEEGLSEEDALDLEIEVIKFYRENKHDLCNITDGGESLSGRRSSEETRLKISLSKKGQKHVFTTEIKLKISKSHKKPILCSNGMFFDGIIDAVTWLKSKGHVKADGSKVSLSCTEERYSISAYGFFWCYFPEAKNCNLVFDSDLQNSTILSEKLAFLLARPNTVDKRSMRKTGNTNPTY